MSVRAKDVLKSVLKAHGASAPSRPIVLDDNDLNVYATMIERLGDARKERSVTFVDGENFLNNGANGSKTFVDLFNRFPQKNVTVFVKWALNNRDPRRYNDVSDSQRKRIVDVCGIGANFCDNEIDDVVLLSCALYETKRHDRRVTILSNDKYKFVGNDPSLRVNLQEYESGTGSGVPVSRSAGVGQAPRDGLGVALMLATPVFATIVVVAALFS
jgi:hypothetical protein